ncbi:glycosyltransferase [Hyphomicrobium sp. NDB2Meth4]|uniref:glycosyltransferase n=1 Tax=Hyphomicrobium sp. NDB2Meth4 TaxID=1892846 RepID=UPI000931F735|nr:glycosyltransferase [Hyphomicrobium sp. NDB2Meth4]
MSDLQSALEFLTSQSEVSLAVLFWYTLIFDVPRYVAVFASLALAEFFVDPRARGSSPAPDYSRVSVIIAGLNEADTIERCVRSLREQSVQGFEIVIVSDGSTDAMPENIRNLAREGVVDSVFDMDLRGGKPAALNLAAGAAKGDVIIVADSDCSFDRFAIERILEPFCDAGIGAVSGDVVVRNARQSLIARFQFIEYLFSISVGKRFDDALGLVKCISGAFGAFRRSAIEQIAGFDAGSGEDLDLTLRLRAAGWRIAFAPEAVVYTAVPTSLWRLFRQRLRWEGDAMGLRFRKHRSLMQGTTSRFNIVEAIHQWEFLFFSVVGALMLPVYVAWLLSLYGSFALIVLMSMEIGLMGLNVIMLLLAGVITGRPIVSENILYVPGYTLFNSLIMRNIRLIAYVEEWFRFRSLRDNYAPRKVREVLRW